MFLAWQGCLVSHVTAGAWPCLSGTVSAVGGPRLTKLSAKAGVGLGGGESMPARNVNSEFASGCLQDSCRGGAPILVGVCIQPTSGLKLVDVFAISIQHARRLGEHIDLHSWRVL